jgi:hypothetical protein
MQSSEIESLCQNVAASVSEVRAVFRSSLPVPEILDRFWCLQDNISRLLEAISDYPAETLQALEGHPRLLTDVVDVLEFSAKLPSLRNIAAVRESAASINNSLLEIQYSRQSRAVAASA